MSYPQKKFKKVQKYSFVLFQPIKNEIEFAFNVCYTCFRRVNATMSENRKVKDSVFVDLFGKDESAPHLTLENTEIKPEILDSVMYMSYANDVAMQINGKIVVLIEHQSTINNNMPLRLLDYVTRIYDKIIPSRDKFKRMQIKIPRPEFYVLYNGTEKTEPYFEARLSEAFESEDKTPPALELAVKVYNINTGIGEDLLKNCEVLKQYSQLIDLIRYSKDHAEELQTEEPFKWAIKEAKKRDILSNYLERKASEVINMFNMEYDYDTDIAVQREEAMRFGMQQGMQQGLQQGMQQANVKTAYNLFKLGLSDEQIALAVNLPISEIKSIHTNV